MQHTPKMPLCNQPMQEHTIETGWGMVGCHVGCPGGEWEAEPFGPILLGHYYITPHKQHYNYTTLTSNQKQQGENNDHKFNSNVQISCNVNRAKKKREKKVTSLLLTFTVCFVLL